MQRLIAIVRHGEYKGKGDLFDPLSEDGRKQMMSVADMLDKRSREYLKNPVVKLFFSFSYTTRAIESIRIISQLQGDIITTDLFLSERDEIKQSQNIAEKVIRLADLYGAHFVVIIAHGAMPAVLAEELSRFCGGVGKRLRESEKGHGYLVNMKNGEVEDVSPVTW